MSEVAVKTELSDEQLEAELKRRKAAKAKKREQERVKYEKERDTTIKAIMAQAHDLCNSLTKFKNQCHETMQSQHIKLSEYGQIRGNSLGGFSITNSEDSLRVVRRRDTQPQWDERGEKAIGLIKEFLSDSVKKRSTKIFEMLMSFLERNKAGDLEYSKVMVLLSHRNKYDDKRWLEGLELLEESFSVHFKGYNYEFRVKDEHGKWENLSLNFSSL